MKVMIARNAVYALIMSTQYVGLVFVAVVSSVLVQVVWDARFSPVGDPAHRGCGAM